MSDATGDEVGESALAVSILPDTSETDTAFIIGLGNAGAEYDRTVHNIGHRVVDWLPERWGGVWEEAEDGQVSSVSCKHGVKIRLFKANTVMNKSGPAVQKLLKRYGGGPPNCIIVDDDIDLHLGQIRLKREGGDGGHKGVRSVVTALGTDTVRRVRVGVRPAGDQRQGVRRVLEKFSTAEDSTLVQALESAVSTIESNLLLEPKRKPE